MGIRLQREEWRRSLRKFITHPVTEILALVALVFVALAVLISLESRGIYSPEAPVVFSPK